jgi:hypothetical protein
MSTCTRQHARCRDSTITLTRYLSNPEGAPAARLPTPEEGARPVPASEGAPTRYLLLRGRPPAGARLLAPEGGEGKRHVTQSTNGKARRKDSDSPPLASHLGHIKRAYVRTYVRTHTTKTNQCCSEI